MSTLPKIIAVDFDGTLFENAWPDVGAPIEKNINKLKAEQADGAKVILWTNRVGGALDKAVNFCKEHGIHLDAVNENLLFISASGKTTTLIEMSEKTGATIVVATYSMSKYIQMAAAQMGKKIPVPITVTNYIRLLASGGLGKSQKYLVDELQMMLEQMNVEAATVDSHYVEVLSEPQKEGL